MGRRARSAGIAAAGRAGTVSPGSQLSAHTNRPILEVLEPGLLTTIQDGGRPGYAHLGVPVSGACDPWGLAQANLLAGNQPNVAAIELTIAGPELRVLIDCVVGIGGADLGAHVPEEFRDLLPGAAHRLRGGTTVRFRAAAGNRSSSPRAGIRSYVALPGGVDVPNVLGSAATCLAGGFGGLEGRAMRMGDRIGSLRVGDLAQAGRTWPLRVGRPPYGPGALRVVRGPHATALGDEVRDWLLATEWHVQEESDRSGVRLVADREPPGRMDEIVSLPMVSGAVQLPPDGRPIILLADHQTVGGYPVAAVVIRADWPRLGQLAPGSTVRFELVEVGEAERAWREQQDGLRAAAQALGQTEAWDALADVAG
jgi:antagonist of KipI